MHGHEMLKLVVYVLCFDERSQILANKAFAMYPWARVVRLLAAGEDVWIMDGLLARKAEWMDADYVGLLSWRAHDRMRVDQVQRACEAAKGHDVVAFMPADEPCASSLPDDLDVWVSLLTSMGYSACDAVSRTIPLYLCNYWAAKPALMAEFLHFCKRALEPAPQTPEPAPQMPEPAPQTPEPATQTFEVRPRAPQFAAPLKSYFFWKHGAAVVEMPKSVYERLPCFFFWKHGASVAGIPLALSTFWQGEYLPRINALAATYETTAEVCLKNGDSVPGHAEWMAHCVRNWQAAKDAAD